MVVSEAGEVCCVDFGTVLIGCGGLLMGGDCTSETTKAWQRLVWCRFLHSLQVNFEWHCAALCFARQLKHKLSLLTIASLCLGSLTLLHLMCHVHH